MSLVPALKICIASKHVLDKITWQWCLNVADISNTMLPPLNDRSQREMLHGACIDHPNRRTLKNKLALEHSFHHEVRVMKLERANMSKSRVNRSFIGSTRLGKLRTRVRIQNDEIAFLSGKNSPSGHTNRMCVIRRVLLQCSVLVYQACI